MITLPYIKKISEKIAKKIKEYRIRTVHKPSHTIKNILLKSKDKANKLDRPGAIYKIKYIGETENNGGLQI